MSLLTLVVVAVCTPAATTTPRHPAVHRLGFEHAPRIVAATARLTFKTTLHAGL